MSCLLEELRIQMDPVLLTVCTVHYNMMFDQHALEMNEKVRNLNKVIRDIHRKSLLPVRLLDVAERMEKKGFPEDTSNDGIHFDRPRGAEWLNDVFQEHINTLEADLLETAQFTLGPPRTHHSLPQGSCLVAWERELTLETVRGATRPDCRVSRQWSLRR